LSSLVFVTTVSADDLESIKENIGEARSLLKTKDHDKGVQISTEVIASLEGIEVDQPEDIEAIFQQGMIRQIGERALN